MNESIVDTGVNLQIDTSGISKYFLLSTAVLSNTFNEFPDETTIRRSFSHRRMIIWEFHVANKNQNINT
jgi:hypothetical protein